MYSFYKPSFSIDRKLYKYYSITKIDYAIDTMKSRRVHLEDTIVYNDPFDSTFLLDDNKFYKLEGYKVSCFSEVRDSILMWGIYAENHKGICVEFDFNRLEDNELNRRIIDSITRVQYSPIRPDSLWINNKKATKDFLFYKSEQWSYEKEWRLVCNTKYEFLPMDCISAVYLGAFYNEKNDKHSTLINTINGVKQCNIYRFVLDEHEFKLNLREYVE